jgi:hypothetical protein
MRYPKFYEQIAARMSNAVKAGDIAALQEEAAFCSSWGSELGLLGRFADSVIDVLKQKPPKQKPATASPKPRATRKPAATTAPTAPPAVAGGWTPGR